MRYTSLRARMMLPSGRCSSVARRGDIEVASILSRLLSPPMSCCGRLSFATVTNGDRLSGHRTVTSSIGVWYRFVQKADHGLVTVGLGVDPLRILGRKVGEDLDLATRETVAFRMRVANG